MNISPISIPAVQAREAARTDTGMFGTQHHGDPGVVGFDLVDAADDEVCGGCRRPSLECSQSPCVDVMLDRDNPPSVDVDDVVDGVVGEWDASYFPDDEDDLPSQVRAAVGGIQVTGRPLDVEPVFNEEDMKMLGMNVGFFDKAHGCTISQYVETKTLFPGIDGTEGRERVEIIAANIVRHYDAVHDSYFPRG